ncbi:30S ribosomal protein S18 [Candidatus Berkelbacteria bacterium CG11_big_fil_rev_8_21_14_0_20_42_15]|uniref:Small ribosomal subunit protein bS18 n=1 Tax=Candidatus Berkelbacteria bacterium CG11_big_fil_rev_8_21_14_0_20_42_15 TaxID=1974517 RepID=A0A2H0PZ85_9BACT|nr:MAG: 30S ribosomal protein S18 [Candidatus Berkelbacteria bacterium CG11_big_fil_rev_8_21_14_0_20_42_15]
MEKTFHSRKKCYFCKTRVLEIDYKDVSTLSRYLNRWSKIDPASRTGVCSKHQRQLGTAIKRARQLALLPYVTR